MSRFRAHRDVRVDGTDVDVRVNAITPAEFGELLNSPAFLSIQKKADEVRKAQERGEEVEAEDVGLDWKERLENQSGVLLVLHCVHEMNGEKAFKSAIDVASQLSAAQITQLAGVVLDLSGVGGGAQTFGDRFRDGVGDTGGD